MSKRMLLAAAGLAALIPAAIVLGTPSSGSTSVLLGRAQYDAFRVRRVVRAPQEPRATARMEHDTEEEAGVLRNPPLWKVKVEAAPALDVATQMITFEPGGQSGWHSHSGPVFISVIEGTMTFYEGDDPDCEPIVRHAGEGFLDGRTDRHAHLARNETTAPAKNLVTYLAPPGAPLRNDAPNPGNCPF